jgi:hypothetical protein
MASAQDGTGVVKVDSWLEPFSDSLRHRYKAYQKWVDTINQHEGGLEKFSRGYEKMGFIVASNGDITYREWAPNATSAHLIGDFSTPPAPLNRSDFLRQLGPPSNPNDKRQLWRLVCTSPCSQRPVGHTSQHQSQGIDCCSAS